MSPEQPGRLHAVQGPETMVAASFEGELLADIPEIAPDLHGLRSWWGEDEPGLHNVVGDVLAPYVERAVDSGERDQLRRSCVFMERMATSPDESLRNALQVSLLEVIGDQRERLEKARRAMGPATLALSHEIERFWGRET
jgi:hypothetical protein